VPEQINQFHICATETVLISQSKLTHIPQRVNCW